MCLNVLVVERDAVDLFVSSYEQEVRPHPFVCYIFSRLLLGGC